ncbi:phosphatase PAP2 family protein [Candidatus Woesearchaeota archaeon]|nr:phosphatase PAP2 family protein [Candidatus Woesearchaeota archaeon]
MKLSKGKSLCFIFFICMYLGYIMIQKVFPTGHILKIPFIDDSIPLISWFAIPYLTMYLITAIPFLLSWYEDKLLFAVSFTFLYAASIAYLIFMSHQTIMIRPEITPVNSFDYLVEYIYSIDPPVNSFPSLHVLYATLSYLCLRRISKKISILILPFAILTSISTVLTKQHFFIDIVGGLILALFAYKIIFQNIIPKKYSAHNALKKLVLQNN